MTRDTTDRTQTETSSGALDRPPFPGGTGERPEGSKPGGLPASPPDPFPDDAAPFAAFAEALAGIAALSGRLDKADRLGALFARLGDADLGRAARWATGRVFPLADERTVEIGTRRIADALESVTEHDADALAAALVRLGDPGEVAAWALGELGATPAGTASDDLADRAGGLTLAEAEAFFATVAETRGAGARTELVAGMLARLGGHAARYLAKMLSGDGLRIGLSEGGVEKALERLYQRPGAAIRRAAMLTGDYGETARLARHDALDSAQLHLFHPIRFMLATAAEASDERTLADDVARQIPPPFAVEDKFDGIRAQAHVELEPDDRAPEGDVPREDLHGEVVPRADGARVRVALFSRTLDAVERSFPELWAPLARLARAEGGFILDGEIVPLDPETGGVAPFARLQTRLGRKRVSAELRAEAPVGFVAYDVLAFDGAARLDAPFAERGAHLDALALPPADAGPPDTRRAVLRSTVQAVDDAEALDALFDAARARGNEGLMVKALGSAYRPGKRGRDWLKVKKALATLDVVVTAAQVGSGGRRHLLSDLTFAVRGPDGDLLNVGKAYSGLTDAELHELTAWFKAHTLETFAHGRVRTVEPEIVLEVTFDAVQASPRHKGGYALRFPRIVRRRPDKPVGEIDTLATVAALAGAPPP